MAGKPNKKTCKNDIGHGRRSMASNDHLVQQQQHASKLLPEDRSLRDEGTSSSLPAEYYRRRADRDHDDDDKKLSMSPLLSGGKSKLSNRRAAAALRRSATPRRIRTEPKSTKQLQLAQSPARPGERNTLLGLKEKKKKTGASSSSAPGAAGDCRLVMRSARSLGSTTTTAATSDGSYGRTPGVVARRKSLLEDCDDRGCTSASYTTSGSGSHDTSSSDYTDESSDPTDDHSSTDNHKSSEDFEYSDKYSASSHDCKSNKISYDNHSSDLVVISPGSSFKSGRYVVLEKLGHGSSSSVWLVWDSIQHQYVALKLLLHKSVESRKWAKEKEEIQILKHIVKEDALNCENVVKMYDHFEHEQHQCMVFEHLGDNLRTLLTQSSSSQDYPTAAAGLPLQIVERLAREILSGLDFLHHQLSVVHNDLKPDNILLMIPSARNSKLPLDDDACLLPTKSSYSRGQKSLSISSSSAATIACCNDPKSVQAAFGCKIADLGSACYVKSLPSKRIVQTQPYRCPEILLGAALSPAADIWSFGCMVFELATGCILFGSTGARRTCHHKDLHHLACMWEILGPIPRKVTSTGKYARHYFKSDGKLRHLEKASLNQVGTGHLEELLQNQHGLPGKDAHELAQFLCPLLDFVPMKRPSTSQCLVHPWLSF
ncbi:unnamed protein product [Sphagnum troendelagicum]|uniref:non-specific serine/threonine protein kinase n=1 Tax=Sphagnum troendelagicum TaxID=128251 RepID=A0ABP0TES7_9BRYO